MMEGEGEVDGSVGSQMVGEVLTEVPYSPTCAVTVCSTPTELARKGGGGGVDDDGVPREDERGPTFYLSRSVTTAFDGDEAVVNGPQGAQEGGSKEKVKNGKRFLVCTDPLLHNVNDAIVSAEIGVEYPWDVLLKSLDKTLERVKDELNKLETFLKLTDEYLERVVKVVDEQETFHKMTKAYLGVALENKEYMNVMKINVWRNHGNVIVDDDDMINAFGNQREVLNENIGYMKWFIARSDEMRGGKIPLKTYRDFLYQSKIDGMLREWDRLFHRYSRPKVSVDKPLREPYEGVSYEEHAHNVWVCVSCLGNSVGHWDVEREKDKGPYFTGCDCFVEKNNKVE